MSSSQLTCPSCCSHHIVKNGTIHNGKPKHKCKKCDRQFVVNPQKKYIDGQTIDIIKKLLLEKIGIARGTGVSEKWPQDYVNTKFDLTPQEIKVTKKS